MRVSTYRVEAVTCPRCLAVMDGLTHVGGGMALPDPGDFTICAYCEAMLVYIDSTTARLANADEEFAAAMDPRIATCRTMAALIRQNRRNRER